MLRLVFKLEERKKVLAKYVEQTDENGAYASGGPKPVIGTLYVRMNIPALNVPSVLHMTLESGDDQ